MERLGKVQEWHDQEGYGFITAVGNGAEPGRVFFHIRDVDRSGRRPEVGEIVRYTTSRQNDGRARALRIRRAVQARMPSSAASKSRVSTRSRDISTPVALLLILSFGAGIAWAINADRLPVAAGVVSVFFSMATYISYALDKDAAQRGRRRIPENTLHGLAVLGGWPGALLAQRVLRHKTRKTSFRVGFWMSAVMNCAAHGWWIFRQ